MIGPGNCGHREEGSPVALRVSPGRGRMGKIQEGKELESCPKKSLSLEQRLEAETSMTYFCG